MPNALSPAWELPESYESRDVVSRLYAEVHGREPGAEKAREMTSALTQAREYFASAGNANELVRPLLLYYGVLGLARWLILFRLRGIREASLAKQHGLDAHNWDETLARGIRAFADTETRVTRGTFTQLIEATGGREAITFHRYDADREFRWRQQLTPAPLPQGFAFSARELLARLTEIVDAYLDAFGQASALRAMYLHDHGPVYPTDGALASSGCALIVDQRPGETDSWIRTAFRLPPNAQITPDTGWTTYHRHRWKVILPTTPDRSLPEILPPVGQTSGGDSVLSRDMIFIREPLRGGIALTTLSLLFAIAYVTGMLVRYYPTHWRSFLSREKGDVALPAIRAATRAVASEFPMRVYESAVSLISEPAAPVFPAFVPSATS